FSRDVHHLYLHFSLHDALPIWFNVQYILESLIVPSKAISDQYLNTSILTKDGEVFNGRILAENAKQITLRPDPFAKEPIVIEKEDRKSTRLNQSRSDLVCRLLL